MPKLNACLFTLGAQQSNIARFIAESFSLRISFNHLRARKWTRTLLRRVVKQQAHTSSHVPHTHTSSYPNEQPPSAPFILIYWKIHKSATTLADNTLLAESPARSYVISPQDAANTLKINEQKTDWGCSRSHLRTTTTLMKKTAWSSSTCLTIAPGSSRADSRRGRRRSWVRASEKMFMNI